VILKVDKCCYLPEMPDQTTAGLVYWSQWAELIGRLFLVKQSLTPLECLCVLDWGGSLLDLM
jgi:hypothetical protein